MLANRVVGLLASLQSSDDNVRSAAEEQYNSFSYQDRCSGLTSILTDSSQSVETRCFTAILLRRLLVQYCAKSSWEPIGIDERNAVLELITRPCPNSVLRKSICGSVAEFARMYSDCHSAWPDVIECLRTIFEKSDNAVSQNALNVIEDFPGIFGDNSDQVSNILNSVLSRYMQSTESTLRNAATIAYGAFVRRYRESDDINVACAKSIPFYLSAVVQSIYDPQPNEVLQSLADLIEDIPNFIKPGFQQFGEQLLEALRGDNVCSDRKHVITEVLISISELANKMFVKQFCPLYLSQFVEWLLRTMSHIADSDEDVIEWATQDEPVEEDVDDMADNIVAETALDRLSSALDETEMAPEFMRVTLDIVNGLLSSERWKEKVAGLLALSASGEGMHTHMQHMLPQLVDGVLAFLADPHPRVRYAACNAIGQMSQDFHPQLQRVKHNSVFPSLLAVMNDEPIPRVQAHAAAAMINLLSGCPISTFRKHLSEVALCLNTLLENNLIKFLKLGKFGVLEQVVTTISAIADMADTEFFPYYEGFVVNLMKLLELVKSNVRYRNLKGKVIECITLVGSSAGKERFLADCQPMIDEILQIDLDIDSVDGSQDNVLELTFVLAAYSRLCAILGEDFGRYLPHIMGPILKAASFKPHITLVSDDETGNFEQDTDDWEFLSLGDKQSFGIRTTGLEYKANACLLLSCCARELKDSFQLYIDEVANLMIPLLRFYFFDSVRSAVAESLPNLLSCVSKDLKKQHKMWETMKPCLLNAITMEPEIDVCSQLLSSLAKILEIVYPSSLTPADLQSINKCILEVFAKYFKAHEDSDETSSDYEVSTDTRSQIISRISDIVHVSFRLLGTQYLPFFDHFVDTLRKLVSAERSPSERQWALCCFDDLVEYTGATSFKYSEMFLQPMFQMIDDPQPEIRQAVAYGIGLMAQKGGDEYISFVQECIEPLMNVIAKPDSRSQENEIATENAISAISKAMASRAFEEEDRNKMIPVWISWLPTYLDYDESEHIYDYLCSLIESASPLVIGENRCNMPALIAIFADCFLQDGIYFGRQTVHRVINLILRVQADPELSLMCERHLTDDQKAALRDAIQEASRGQQVKS